MCNGLSIFTVTQTNQLNVLSCVYIYQLLFNVRTVCVYGSVCCLYIGPPIPRSLVTLPLPPLPATVARVLSYTSMKCQSPLVQDHWNQVRVREERMREREREGRERRRRRETDGERRDGERMRENLYVNCFQKYDMLYLFQLTELGGSPHQFRNQSHQLPVYMHVCCWRSLDHTSLSLSLSSEAQKRMSSNHIKPRKQSTGASSRIVAQAPNVIHEVPMQPPRRIKRWV